VERIESIKKVVKNRALVDKDVLVLEESMLEVCRLCDVQKNLIKLNSLFTNLSDGIIIFGIDFKVVDANRKGKVFLAEYEYLNYENQEYKLIDLPILKDLQTNEEWENLIKVTTQNKKNERRVFNISRSLIYSKDYKLMGICVVVNNVTEIEKQVRQMEDMMSSFTHDLKTPLIALETNIEHILEGEYGEINEKLRNILSLMLSSSSNTLRLVKNLLTVFKYDTKSYRLLPREVNVREIINNAIRLVEPILNGKKIRMVTELESNFTVYCDPFEIERVVTNLLSNAIKFSPEGSEVKISATKEGEFFFFKIQDEGMGIASEQLSSLFGRFWQSKIYDHNTNGTGLGLYLSRQIIEAHGGLIWAESEVGKGTKISFKIPSVKSLVTDETKEVKHEYSI